MPTVYGKAHSGTDTAKLAPGTSHDAGVRRFRNVFDLAVDGGGGTTSAMLVGRVREGNCVEGARVTSDVNCSGINFTLGTDAEPAKYAAAFAGPAANASVTPVLKVAALAADALDTPEDVKLFPSGNLPAAGIVVASVYTSKR